MKSHKLYLTEIDLDEFKSLLKELLKELNQENINSSTQSDDALMDRSSTAKFLNISLPTLMKLVKNGEVPAYHVGNKIMFKKSEVLSSLKMVQKLKFKR